MLHFLGYLLCKHMYCLAESVKYVKKKKKNIISVSVFFPEVTVKWSDLFSHILLILVKVHRLTPHI